MTSQVRLDNSYHKGDIMGNEIVCSSVLVDVYDCLNITLNFNANSLKTTILGPSFKPIFESLRRTALNDK